MVYQLNKGKRQNNVYLNFGTWRENLNHTALSKFTFVQDWLAEHRPVNGPKPLSCATGCKRTVRRMYKRITNKSINYKRQTKAAIELITPSRAQGDAVLGYLCPNGTT